MFETLEHLDEAALADGEHESCEIPQLRGIPSLNDSLDQPLEIGGMGILERTSTLIADDVVDDFDFRRLLFPM